MKTISFFLFISVVFFLFTGNCFGAWVEVVIDPGHGGPGASKYNNNGGGYNQWYGEMGPVKKLTEQWVNLQVAFALRDFNFTDNFISDQMDSHYPKSENKRFILYKFCVLQAMGCSEEGKKVTEFKHKPSNREEA